MGGIGDFLFGEDPQMTTQQTPRMTGEQMTLLNSLASMLTGQIGKGVPTYEGLFTPGASPLQTEAFGMASGVPKMGLDFIQDLLGRGDQAEMDYWTKAVKAPALESWEKDILPIIMEKYAGMNALDSGAARRAVATSGSRLTTDLSAQLAELLFGSRQQKVGMAGQGMDLISSILGMGTAQRGIGAEQGQEALSKWQMSQPWANPFLQLMGIPLGIQPYDISAYQTGGSGGLFGGVLSAMGGGFGKAAGTGLAGLIF